MSAAHWLLAFLSPALVQSLPPYESSTLMRLVVGISRPTFDKLDIKQQSASSVTIASRRIRLVQLLLHLGKLLILF